MTTTTITDQDKRKGLCSFSSPQDCPCRACHDTNNDSVDKERKRQREVWHKPWMTALVFFFLFYILWFYRDILNRYWIQENFAEALPGLDKTVLRKFTMRSHMTLGGLAILCSPIQMVTPFTVGWNKTSRLSRNSNSNNSNAMNWYRRIHKYSGRFYVLCAIGSFVFGQWFILLKEFLLVGGYNMGISFSLAGFFIAYSAYMTWKTAPKAGGNKLYTIEDHRNWAIRSFSQIIAPVLYRFWYIFMMVFKVYRMPFLAGGDKRGKLDCDDRDVCPDYQRHLDSVYAWMYWIGAWMVAELVIVCLPPHQSSQKAASATASTTTNKTLEARNEKEEVSSLEQPLLSPSDDESTSPATDSDTTSTTSSTESDERREENGPPFHQVVVNDKQDASLPLVVNFLGCLLAVLSATVLVPVLIMTFKTKK